MGLINSGYWDGGLTCLKYEKIVLTGSVQQLSNYPTNAKSAIICIELDPSQTPTSDQILCRFTEALLNPPDVATRFGMPLTHLATYEISASNILNFQIVATQFPNFVNLNISYYG